MPNEKTDAREKLGLNKQFLTILNKVLFGIGLLISFNTFAGNEIITKYIQDDATNAKLQNQINTLQTKIDNFPVPVFYSIGEILPDGSIVAWVDFTGRHGLAVWPSDSGPSNWYSAKKLAEDHGPGWRLPTMHELVILLNLAHDLAPCEIFNECGLGGGFSTDSYWSSTEFDATNSWGMNFNRGLEGSTTKDDTSFLVRPVRLF